MIALKNHCLFSRPRYVIYKSIRSTNIRASSLSYKVFEKAANAALSKVKFGHISGLTEPQSRSLFSFLCGNDTRQNFLRIFKHSWKTTVKKITFLNVHLLCKKPFIDCLFVLSVVFEKYLENSAAFGRAIVREIRHVLLVTKFACVDSFLDAIIA